MIGDLAGERCAHEAGIRHDADLPRSSRSASGYLLKTAAPEEVLAGIRAVHSGSEWFHLPSCATATTQSTSVPLTARQREVLELLAKGFSNKEIAAALQFSEHGAKAHLKAIFAKLGVKDRAQAIIGVQAGADSGAVIGLITACGVKSGPLTQSAARAATRERPASGRDWLPS